MGDISYTAKKQVMQTIINTVFIMTVSILLLGVGIYYIFS